MRILSLTPGTGGTFYCENCLRDGQMVRALRRLGHDLTVVPLYLPILLDSDGLNNDAGVFFGGVNVFLQQQMGLFRSTPRWLDRLLDSAWMLRKAAAREGSTRASDLGPMTYSMLQGRDGRQRKELSRFLTWLADQPKPDVAHISNALLLGVASEIKSALGVPIVCSLQDEDTWIDAMSPMWRDRCWKIIAEKSRDVDAFVSVSRWYAGRISDRTGIARESIRVVPLGIETTAAEPAPMTFDPPVLGVPLAYPRQPGIQRARGRVHRIEARPSLVCIETTRHRRRHQRRQGLRRRDDDQTGRGRCRARRRDRRRF